jgi:hypothetical protein
MFFILLGERGAKLNQKNHSTIPNNETADNPNPESTQMLLQLHLAEYQALTNRCTYWISLQFAVFSILLVYLGLVAQVWNSLNRAFLIWGSALVVEIVAVLWSQLLSEQYLAIHYLERELRPLIERLVKGKSFWGYEPYLARQRGTRHIWWEFSMVLPMLLVIIAITLVRLPLSLEDYVGLFLNASLFIFLMMKTISFVRIRRSFSSAPS